VEPYQQALEDYVCDRLSAPVLQQHAGIKYIFSCAITRLAEIIIYGLQANWNES